MNQPYWEWNEHLEHILQLVVSQACWKWYFHVEQLLLNHPCSWNNVSILTESMSCTWTEFFVYEHWCSPPHAVPSISWLYLEIFQNKSDRNGHSSLAPKIWIMFSRSRFSDSWFLWISIHQSKHPLEVSNGSMQTCYQAYGCGWIRTMCFLTPYSYVVGFGCITHLQEPTKVKAAEMKCSKHSMVQIK